MHKQIVGNFTNLIKPIAFLTFSLSLLSSDPIVPNITQKVNNEPGSF